jgi:protein-tyrosine phosphatase
MRQVGEYALWLGHAGDLQNPRAVMDAGIEAVVELADNEQLADLPRSLIRLRFPLSDGGENPPWLLRLATDSVASLLGTGVPTLVCCSGGLSRSICVAAGAVALVAELPLVEALAKVIGSGPADVSPGLFAQLHRALNG